MAVVAGTDDPLCCTGCHYFFNFISGKDILVLEQIKPD